MMYYDLNTDDNFIEFNRHSYDLNEWLNNIYNYYQNKGFYPIILQHIILTILQLIVMGATIYYIGECININTVINYDENIIDSINLCNNAFISPNLIMIIFLLILSIKILYEIFKIPHIIWHNYSIKKYYNDILKISDTELQSLQFSEIISRIKDDNTNVVSYHDLNELEIVNIIMRKENYIISIMNNNIINVNMPFTNYPIITKTLEWSFDYCIYSLIFNKRGIITFDDENQKEKIINTSKFRLKLIAIGMLILSPLICIYLIIYFLFKYFESIKNQKGFLSIKDWTRLAKYKFRDYNELYHIYINRLNKTYKPANKYLASFNNYEYVTIIKFMMFIIGTAFSILFIGSILNENILSITIFHKSVLWYLSIFAVVLTILRNQIPQPFHVFEPAQLMQKVINHTHNISPDWVQRAHHHDIKMQFSGLFINRLIGWLLELLSVFFNPFILLRLQNKIEIILEFIIKSTTYNTKIGNICAVALFDIDDMSITQLDVGIDEKNKLEVSMVQFKSHFPQWEITPSQSRIINNSFAQSELPNNIGISYVGNNILNDMSIMIDNMDEGINRLR